MLGFSMCVKKYNKKQLAKPLEYVAFQTLLNEKKQVNTIADRLCLSVVHQSKCELKNKHESKNVPNVTKRKGKEIQGLTSCMCLLYINQNVN